MFRGSSRDTFSISSKREAQLPALSQALLPIFHIPEGGLEIPIVMIFAHGNQAITSKMEEFVTKQTKKMEEKLDADSLMNETELHQQPDNEENTSNFEKLLTPLARIFVH